MRLLRIGPQGKPAFTKDLIHGKDVIPPYAILSHTWEADHDNEVTYKDIRKQRGIHKPGYRKIGFCAGQAKADSLQYFWVDTCCIDKTNAAELAESINSMFRWYQDAAKCYVYLSDVSFDRDRIHELSRSTWMQEFRNSRWFTRGWTLQELIAPGIVEFFSSNKERLGDKKTLSQAIHEATGIPIRVLQETSLSECTVEERISWSKTRTTSKREDRAYSLLGLLSISMPIIYGEGEEQAFERLRGEIAKRSPLKVLTQLPIADGAAFDSLANEHGQCLLGTRIDILDEIVRWANDPHSKTVYWLNGMAGTGKSTISRTLAQRFLENNCLGATFFFKRGEGDRGGMSKFFTTIVSQLIQQLPETARHVQATIEADPTITSKAMGKQFQKLIIDPVSQISSTTDSPRTCLIVIDALDECQGEEDVKAFINLLTSAKKVKNIQLKFFLTSRPELHILKEFQAANDKYQDFMLHEIADSVIEHDITVYLKHQLGRVREDFNRGSAKDQLLPANWPSQTAFATLVRMAIPLFIFAATICRFIDDRRVGSPDEQLKEVLKYETKSQESQLDATYLPVLHSMLARLNQRARQRVINRFNTVVGPIITLATPLPRSALAQLLNVTISTIDGALETLRSVLNIPRAPDRPIRLLHLSFRDFLVDPARREDPFWINEQELEECKELTGFLSDSARFIQAMGPSIQAAPLQVYSSALLFSPKESIIRNLFKDNLSKYIGLEPNMPLFWSQKQATLEGHTSSVNSVVFSPDGQQVASASDDKTVILWSAATGEKQATLEGHTDYVRSVAFSPDNQRVASASDDKTVIFWSAATGEKQATLEGHTDYVNSVAFSPDGQRVASASNDKTVIFWSAATGEKQATLEGHTDYVRSVAFSPDGQRVASASRDETVILWSAATGEKQATLEGHMNWVSSVAFSPDGQQVASASNDKTVILWSAATGEKQVTLEGHTGYVRSVAFSPDGQRVASSSSDKTVMLWSAKKGEKQATLEGHTDYIRSVAFSPNGQRVASASNDKTVIFWSAATGEKQATLEGHTDYVSSVTFSPDGQRVASASNDKTVILWSAATGEKQATLEGHTDYIRSVAFSPDNQRVASASRDKTVILWSAATGEKQATLEGHTDYVNSVAFSPDNQRVASASDDKTVIFWSAATGEKQATLEGHTDWVRSVAFSPDGQRVASASRDKTVILWSAATGDKQATLDTGFIDNLRFDLISTQLLTNRGSFIIDFADGISSKTSPGASFGNVLCISYGISKDNCWITFNGQNLLSLPIEYRPTRFAVFGNTLAIGCSVGNVLILRIIYEN
ncbi:hypothetical protein TruAng_007028 [Truncatella angustata]|nr:hypothetical protein TruAng_007028 [Truncatella angustata]